jgi:hypothetical protein
MERNTKEEQTPGMLESRACIAVIPARRSDYRLPHEVAADILAAANEVVVKKQAWEKETRK